jgi:hypothetical protein
VLGVAGGLMKGQQGPKEPKGPKKIEGFVFLNSGP